MEGSSLLPLALNEDDKVEHLVFSMGFNMESMMRISLRTQNWKLIFTPKENKYELYNLKDGLKELNNLASSEKEQFEILKEKLISYIRQIKPPIKKRRVILDEESKKRLRSLGYLR